jgi:hypothetical protein
MMSRRTFIYLALSLMTASWITGLLWAILHDSGPPPLVTVAVLTLLTWIPLGVSRWVRSLELRQDLYRGILGGFYAFLVLLVVSSGFYNNYGLFGRGWIGRVLGDELSSATFLNQVTSLLLTTLCWWLGLMLGDMRLSSTNLRRYFYLCILALVLPAIFFVSDVSQDLVWLYFAVLFTGLTMLGMGRVEETARRSQDQGSPFTFYWLAQIGLVSGVLLLLVGLAQALRLAQGLGLVLALVAPVISVLIFPIVYAGAKLLILSGLRLTVPAPSVGPSGAADAGRQADQVAQPATGQSLVAGLLLLLGLFLLYRLFRFSVRRWRHLAEDLGQEERAATPSLGDRISEALAERLTRRGLNLPGLGRIRRHLVARSIRRIYAALTALAAERGYPRAAARTPYEYLPALRRAFPGCEVQVAQITEAYVAAHYGQVPDSREALEEIKSTWDGVRELARRSAPQPGAESVPGRTAAGVQESSRGGGV